MSDLADDLQRLAKWCQAQDANATIYLHAIEAIDRIEALESALKPFAESWGRPERKPHFVVARELLSSDFELARATLNRSHGDDNG